MSIEPSNDAPSDSSQAEAEEPKSPPTLGEARPGLGTVVVNFRLTGTGRLIDIGALRPEGYKLFYPEGVAWLAAIRGTDVVFSRVANDSARVELQLYDPELRGWTSYFAELPAVASG